MIRRKVDINIITSIDDIYNCNINEIIRLGNSYIAKSEDEPTDIYIVSKTIIDELIFDHSSSINDAIDMEEDDDVKEFAETLEELCKLKAGIINRIKLW